MPVFFASSREQQAGFIGFDFVFNTRTLIIQMAHVEEITIHQGTDQEGVFESSGLFALPAKHDSLCTAIVAMAKVWWCGSNPLIGIQLLPRPHVACKRSGTFATIPFA